MTITAPNFPVQQVVSDEAPDQIQLCINEWRKYDEQGLKVFPLVKGAKHPGEFGIKWGEDWIKKNRNPINLLDIYETGTYGLWLATGQCSKRVVLDLDKPEAETYWQERLGEAVFNSALKVTSGRDGGTHLHFAIRADDTRAWDGHSDEAIGFDFRGDGGGVVLPPSVHKSGRRYTWLAGELQDAPECLRKENQPKKRKDGPTGAGSGSKAVQDLMLDPVLGARGNNWLTRVAGTVAKAFYSKDVYMAVLHNINQASADPIDQPAFEKTVESVWKSEQENNQMPSPESPVKVARRLIEDTWTTAGHPTLRRWRGSWMKWTGAHWREVENQSVTADIQDRLEHAWYEAVDKRTGELIKPGWDPNTSKVNDVANAVKNINLLSEDVDSGDWLDGHDAGRMVAFHNGLLDIKSRKVIRATPAFFNTTSLPYDYEETDDLPTEWIKFLHSVWPDDVESTQVLQEWFGYVLSGQTDLQKALMLIGPTRSGKGVIGTVLEALVGKDNKAGMNMSAFATNFGLSPLVGKMLAIVGDARTPKRDRELILERLLSIIGEDTVTVDRKNREPYNGKLGSRLVLMSNELPSFSDPSGAIAGRFVILTMNKSFLGQEDTGLKGRLLQEIPAILRWSLDGLDRLMERGRFTEPESSADTRDEFDAKTSRIKEFVADRCVIGSDQSIPVQDLFDEYIAWCSNRKYETGSVDTFGGQLSAAFRGQFKKVRGSVKGRRITKYQGIGLNRG
ncbi:phage/plasmid primase, P4 family [Streptomyces anulatus]|uniref:ATP binding protein n=1 Tax=Streptomyces microflavus DSM 40593 TaxID=1303692 RepID=N0CZR4_STRMI|nr:phage/plasmid primase, P4 family [Streptomyces microflavus]AGK80449.1 ATP binding protein [Streptomyces microflavus DSM 40593]